jgi:hypothetical protein
MTKTGKALAALAACAVIAAALLSPNLGEARGGGGGGHGHASNYCTICARDSHLPRRAPHHPVGLNNEVNRPPVTVPKTTGEVDLTLESGR